MALRKEELEEGGWHGWITGSVGAGGVGAGEPEAGDKGDQEKVGTGSLPATVEGFPTTCSAPSVFGVPGAGKEQTQDGVKAVPCQLWQCRKKGAR